MSPLGTSTAWVGILKGWPSGSSGPWRRVLAKGVRNFYAQFRVCSNASLPVSTRLTGGRLPRRRTDATQSGVYQLQPPGRDVSPGVPGPPQTLGGPRATGDLE